MYDFTMLLSTSTAVKDDKTCNVKMNSGIYGLEQLINGRKMAVSSMLNSYETEYQHQHKWVLFFNYFQIRIIE